METQQTCPECGAPLIKEAYMDWKEWALSLVCREHGYVTDAAWPFGKDDEKTPEEMRVAGFEVVY